MRRTYRVLAYVVAGGVVVQAAAMVWAVAGLGHWIGSGGVADQAMMESQGTPFPEALGFLVHGINGSIVIPVAALALLVVSFFTRAWGAIRWAVVVFVLTAVQAQLGYLGHELPSMGALHGLNALALFTCALVAARRRLVPKAQAQAQEPAPVEAERGGLAI